MKLTEFLLARIAEDEAVALPARGPGDGEWASWNRSWDTSPMRDLAVDGVRVATLPMTIDEHVCRHSPARVLAECEAKRRIVAKYSWADGHRCATEKVDERCHEDGETHNAARDAWETLRILALPYADHRDYLPEWAL